MFKKVFVVHLVLVILMCSLLVSHGNANVLKLEAESATDELQVNLAEDATASGGKLGCIQFDTEAEKFGLVFENVPASTGIELFYATPIAAVTTVWLYTNGAYEKLCDIDSPGNGDWFIKNNAASCKNESITIPTNSKIKITTNGSINYDYINLILAPEINPSTSDNVHVFIALVVLSLLSLVLVRKFKYSLSR